MFGKTKQALKRLWGNERILEDRIEKLENNWEEEHKISEQTEIPFEEPRELSFDTGEITVKGLKIPTFRRSSVLGFRPNTPTQVSMAPKGYLTHIDYDLSVYTNSTKDTIFPLDFPVNLIRYLRVGGSNSIDFVSIMPGEMFKAYCYLNYPLRQIGPFPFFSEQDLRITLPVHFGTNKDDKYDLTETIRSEGIYNLMTQVNWFLSSKYASLNIKSVKLNITEYGVDIKPEIAVQVWGGMRKAPRFIPCLYSLAANMSREISFPTGTYITKLYLLSYGEEDVRNGHIIERLEIEAPYENKKISYGWAELERMSAENINQPVLSGAAVIDLTKLGWENIKKDGLDLTVSDIGEYRLKCFAGSNPGNLAILWDTYQNWSVSPV